MQLSKTPETHGHAPVNPPQMATSLDGLGVPTYVAEALLLKLLNVEPKINLLQLTQKLAISSNLIQLLINQMREHGYIEVLQPDSLKTPVNGAQGLNSSILRYQLTSSGEEQAKAALKKDGYVGPVPVPLRDYQYMAKQQSLRHSPITQDLLREALKDVYGANQYVDLIGPAINSGRAILFYGDPGTGKSYIANRIIRSLNTPIYIPYAVFISGNIVRLFTPQHHHELAPSSEQAEIFFNQHHDRRWVLCSRPLVQVGGELTMNMLEVSKCEATDAWLAPLQMMANNGIFIIDDFGRQAMPTDRLLNRWIVPMEYQIDYLSLPNGQQATIPFVTTLIFSTNLTPREIGDPAFLRRLGYKVHFPPLEAHDYQALWQAQCDLQNFLFDEAPLQHLLLLHKRDQVAYYPCIPKDITRICHDLMVYKKLETRLTPVLVESAWQIYFSDEQLKRIAL
ncbi:AAA family ATPase [Vibrio sp. CK2-1]|uniref:ATP-binding protein n=1 Tax=Vibrio sp. CK2-1 TaxID=2912249 RepID=UPI001F1D30A0|nr:AAA family ATPase [Vibrio sp. CK2-1]MCF7354020.1 AAA family ATPase [Vibrio sp. CK2-1]